MGEKHRQSGASRSLILERLSALGGADSGPGRPQSGAVVAARGVESNEWQDLHALASEKLNEAGMSSRMVATKWELVSLLTSQLYSLRQGAVVGDFRPLFPDESLFPLMRRQLPMALPLLEATQATQEELAELPVGITLASALIAQTGTLVLEGETACELATSLLPRSHWVVVPVDRIVADVFSFERQFGGGGAKNRVFVGGPSRTADIEKTLVWGVHGPWSVSVCFYRTDISGRS